MAAKNLLERLRSPVEVRVTVPAPPEAVFAVLSDPETYPEWLAGAQHIRHVDDDFPAEGSAFDHEVGPSDGGHRRRRQRGALVGRAEPARPRGARRSAQGRSSSSSSSARPTGTLVTFRERITGALGSRCRCCAGPIFLRNKASLDQLRQRFEPLVVRL